MSTDAVPGFVPENNDELHIGCWAEHEDGSYIFVQGIENHKVIYMVFDMSEKPPARYLDSMSEYDFFNFYSWDRKGGKIKKFIPRDKKGSFKPGEAQKVPNLKWKWHDKTPFPWEKIMELGFPPGETLPLDEAVEGGDKRAERVRTRLDVDVNDTQDPDEEILNKVNAAQKVRDALKLRSEVLKKDDVNSRLNRVGATARTIIGNLMKRLSK